MTQHSKFSEAALESAIISLLGEQGFPHVLGSAITRAPEEVLIKSDLRSFLARKYADDEITAGEIESVIKQLDAYSAADLYASNKAIMKLVCDGFLLKREDRSQKDLYVQLIDYAELEAFWEPKPGEVPSIVAEEPAKFHGGLNIFKIVNQLEIVGHETRIPDGILYINGLPLVVFEFKSAIREEATIHDAYVQLATRYARDIPELMKYHAFCVISDGVNNKVGSIFAKYDFFYPWRKVTGDEVIEKDGINSLHTMINGLFDKRRLIDVIRNFVYLPDVSRTEEKIVCRYPQYYAARKLFANIAAHRKPEGDGKGGTYFGATGCGKSFTMLFLARLLMKSVEFSSPTIVLITDRTDLDSQLSDQFSNAKGYIGDADIESVQSRSDLRKKLKGRKSGGVFLTTVHKFNEDAELLTDRCNVICISDEAHRSQVNLDQKLTITDSEVKKSYGFAWHLHNSLPNATYVGFTGTPIDATLDVFGQVVDSYTMAESVKDEITVRLVYEGRAAKVLADNSKLKEIEAYYQRCMEAGSSDYAVEQSKKVMASMKSILGDKDRLAALAKDFVTHYETRIEEGSTIMGKAMFVSSSREIAYDFYKEVIKLRPEWAEVRVAAEGVELSDQQKKQIKPMERIKMVMTRGKDDTKELYDVLGSSEYRKMLDGQFKNPQSNFKIAIVVDMWLTGFDVPFLDTIYIDKPVQKHNLIQTISRVNRKFEGKDKGLVVDYFGIKSAMNQALAMYSKTDATNFEDVQLSITEVRNHLDLLARMFHVFDSTAYFAGDAVAQLDCLNRASEFVQLTDKIEHRFMQLVKRLKAAYDVCCGAEEITEAERDQIHFYLAIRSIIAKLTKGDAPDTAQMNAKVREMIDEAIKSDGVEEIFKLGDDQASQIDLFNEDYLTKISNIQLPNTKAKLLQQLLKKAISELKKVNKMKGVDFSEKFNKLVEKYNERKESEAWTAEGIDDLAEEMLAMFHELAKEYNQGDMPDGIADMEVKAFYDILKALAIKYKFDYPEEKLIPLSEKVKSIVDDKTKYTDWSQRADIKAELKVDLIMALADKGYPPMIDRDEVYKEIFEQAENFKKYQESR
ncbi:type I restriction endonuclease subunit R [Persicirhabdus sediminis]|uniref:Type I restriction enzyme endonuclease subunit n=1 Tax=Persicirhabdus sediminis TaxID=454144 RepID=A0A8J7MES4_9BACT|nr:HsdR family type I site-specific deoxyribonuclease [Persicirhabdus sediminis]MBK1791348.1 type I restriction endonuclease subunit R [Persicirhabdus sediminis]